jgi:hypothetical protein
MHFACWVIKVTDTHSQYVILIAFPREQSFRERSSVKGLHVHGLSSLYLSKLFPNRDSWLSSFIFLEFRTGILKKKPEIRTPLINKSLYVPALYVILRNQYTCALAIHLECDGYSLRMYLIYINNSGAHSNVSCRNRRYKNVISLTGTYFTRSIQHVWVYLLVQQQTDLCSAEIFSHSCIAGLDPQSPRNFAWQPSARISQNLQPCYLSHMTAVTT